MSTPSPGLDALEFSFPGTRTVGAFAPVLVGVVGSGHLEVLMEPHDGPDCRIRVETSARGFRPIWAAVLADFHARHRWSGLRVSINDMGATPAVVALRLAQAEAELLAGDRT
ncbi:malonate decarboxylase delta subunit [Sphaerotilus sulfidivorans]|uniref:Malonate decarboxylase acyl carrier protein n=1 Tax=Sphaerotilus sulfidivorans TaxID=639200 RepID=A0A5C1PW98_9BURK|nr:malonate decarboxylase acyl carrier protein [Sphaerotilus sulfidivorans]MCK6401805.1 malonate decarboxylase acyl carrier protein [Sphaerotilus sulfidivorans]NZD44913.1 malonate decarboxylase acyl carrier protein [Sphaerotilus sulfidivorans]QEM99577.1 malonate decarboxylase acyl carrier protein [Sphaerotilus sulfidivorans]